MINGAGAVEWKEKKQVDWNENDEGSSGFVKNRIGGYTEEEVVEIELKASDFTVEEITAGEAYHVYAIYKGVGGKLLPRYDIYPSFLCQEKWDFRGYVSSLDGKNEIEVVRNNIMSEATQSDVARGYTRVDIDRNEYGFDIMDAVINFSNVSTYMTDGPSFKTIVTKSDENIMDWGSTFFGYGLDVIASITQIVAEVSSPVSGLSSWSENYYHLADLYLAFQLPSDTVLSDVLSKVKLKVVITKRTKWGIPSHYIVPTYNSYEHEAARLVVNALVDPSDESCYYAFEMGGDEIKKVSK